MDLGDRVENIMGEYSKMGRLGHRSGGEVCATAIVIFRGDTPSLIDYGRRFSLTIPEEGFAVTVLHIDGNEAKGKRLEKVLGKGFSYIPLPKAEKIATVLRELIARGKGEYVIVMRGEIVPEAGWWEAIVEMLQVDRATKMVTPRIVDAEGFIVEGGFSEFGTDGIAPYGFGEDGDDPVFQHPCRIPSGSQYFLLIDRSALPDDGLFDERITDPGLLLMDAACMCLERGLKACYQPRALFRVVGISTGRYKMFRGNLLTERALNSLRPVIMPLCKGERSGDPAKFRVLVLGVYLADKPGNIDDIVARLGEASSCAVKQKWVAVGGEAPTARVAEVTVKYLKEPKPKYEILNNLLSGEEWDRYDYVINADDDIVLPLGFLDVFLDFQDRLAFAIAQPARTRNSYFDHPIVQQHKGVYARRTMFVEIGPFISFHKYAYGDVFPFDLTSDMGWGYENIWAYRMRRRGMKMGIIDATPVDHSIRKPVAHYSWERADRGRKALLSKHPHLPLEECFSVMDVYGVSDVSP